MRHRDRRVISTVHLAVVDRRGPETLRFRMRCSLQAAPESQRPSFRMRQVVLERPAMGDSNLARWQVSMDWHGLGASQEDALWRSRQPVNCLRRNRALLRVHVPVWSLCRHPRIQRLAMEANAGNCRDRPQRGGMRFAGPAPDRPRFGPRSIVHLGIGGSHGQPAGFPQVPAPAFFAPNASQGVPAPAWNTNDLKASGEGLLSRFSRTITIFLLVPAQGFEPWTIGLKDRCSAKLSYAG